MSTNHVRNLAAAMQNNLGNNQTYDFWGVVIAVNAGPPDTVTVTVNGAPTTSAITCRYSSAYARSIPTVGDVVFGRHGDKG